ncbi:MAG: hypothetical protein HY917_01930 [Candidatus Diapherotrites archaeon]|nr:hypothetical protein [Candidatus Diapherotrites archaeon]
MPSKPLIRTPKGRGINSFPKIAGNKQRVAAEGAVRRKAPLTEKEKRDFGKLPPGFGILAAELLRPRIVAETEKKYANHPWGKMNLGQLGLERKKIQEELAGSPRGPQRTALNGILKDLDALTEAIHGREKARHRRPA